MHSILNYTEMLINLYIGVYVESQMYIENVKISYISRRKPSKKRYF